MVYRDYSVDQCVVSMDNVLLLLGGFGGEWECIGFSVYVSDGLFTTKFMLHIILIILSFANV